MANKISVEFVAKGHQGVTRAVAALNKQVQQLAAANAMLQKGTGKLSVAQQRLVDSLLNTQRGLRNVGKTATTTGATFSVLRSKMLLASFGASLFSASILRLTNMAGDAAEQMSKAQVVFGDSFGNMTKWANEFSDSVNRSKYQMIEFAASVQDILVPMGMARFNAAELSKEIVELAVDVGSFSNQAPANVMRDFNSALVGNHETVRKYGIVISEARMKNTALRKGIIKSGETLTDQQKILARLAIIQADSADAMGDAARTADSYANVLEGLRAQAEETAITWGQMLLPVVKTIAEALTLLLKVAERPTGIIILSAAFLLLAKRMFFIPGRMFGIMRSMVKVRKGARALGLTLKSLAGSFLLLEAAYQIYLAFQPEEIFVDAEKKAEDYEKKMEGVRDTIKALTYRELIDESDKWAKATDKTAGHIDDLNDALEILKDDTYSKFFRDLYENISLWPSVPPEIEEYKDAMKMYRKEYLDLSEELNEIIQIGEFAGEDTGYEIAIKEVENALEVVKEKHKENKDMLAEYEKALEAAQGNQENFATSQQKLARAAETLSGQLEQQNLLLMTNKEIHQMVIDAAKGKTFDSEEAKNLALLNQGLKTVTEAQFEFMRANRLSQESFQRFGLTFKQLEIVYPETAKELEKYIDALDEKKVNDTIIKLREKMYLQKDLSESDKILTTFQQNNIKVTKDQKNEIIRLTEAIEENKRAKEAAKDIESSDKEVRMLQARLDAGGELSEVTKLQTEIEHARATNSLKYNDLEIMQLMAKAMQIDEINAKLEEQQAIADKAKQEKDRVEGGLKNLNDQSAINHEIANAISQQLANQTLTGEQLEDNIRIETRRLELERENLGLSAERIQEIIDEEEYLRSLNEQVQQRLEDEQKIIDEQNRKESLAKQEAEAYKKTMQGLETQLYIMSEQNAYGKELSASEKFRVEMMHKVHTLTQDEIDAQADILDQIEQQTEEYQKQAKQKDINKQHEKAIGNLEYQTELLKRQIDTGKELSAGEQFKLEAMIAGSDLNIQQIIQQAELLDLIEKQTEELREQQEIKEQQEEKVGLRKDIYQIRKERGQQTPSQQLSTGITQMLIPGGESGYTNALEGAKRYYNDMFKMQDQFVSKIASKEMSIGLMPEGTSEEVKKKNEEIEALKELEQEYTEWLAENENNKSELIAQAQQMAMDTFNMFVQSRKDAMNQQLNDELDALKKSGAYNRASDKKKEQMEEDVKKKYAKRNKEIFKMEQNMKMAQVAMDTGVAIMKAFASWGWPAGLPIAALFGAMGAAQIAMIASQEAPKLAEGGLIGGKLHSEGGTLIEAERGEFVMSRRATESIGLETLNALNKGQRTGNNINIVLEGNILSDDFVADEFIPKLEERIRVLSDGTITDRFA